MGTIQKVSKTVDVFTVGGREFISEAEAKAFEVRLKQQLAYTFYEVSLGFDHTEGRGYFAHEIVAVQHDTFGGHTKNAVFVYCQNTHGAPITEWYGRPLAEWCIGDGRTFDDLEERTTWLRERRAAGSRYGYRFHGVAYIDGYGKPLPEQP